MDRLGNDFDDIDFDDDDPLLEDILHILDEDPFEDLEVDLEDFTEVCPLCDSINLSREGRCMTCLDCGWSKCSI